MSAADGDEEELRDSLARIAHSNSAAPRQQAATEEGISNNSSGGHDRPPPASSQPATAHPTSSTADRGEATDSAHQAAATAAKDAEPAPSPSPSAAAALTVEDETLEADNKNEDIATAPAHNDEERVAREQQGGAMNGAASD